MAMYPVMEWKLFPPGENHVLSQQKLLYLIEALARANQAELKAKPYPLLYESGVVYKEEPPGKENWADAPTILKHGWGDCEDLAGWLVAELREVFNVPCRPFLKFRKVGGSYRYHALVILPNGYKWDFQMMRNKGGAPVIGPGGKPIIRRVRKPIFKPPFVFEDPSARLGMGGRPFSNRTAYAEIAAKTRDPVQLYRRRLAA